MKLNINTWAGIFDIVASVFYLVGPFMGIGVADVNPLLFIMTILVFMLL